MNILQKAVANIFNIRQPGLSRTSVQRKLFQYLSGHAPIFMDDNPLEYINKGYQMNSDVYSVVNHITNAISSVPPVVNKIVDDNAARKYYRMKSHRRYDTSERMIEKSQELKQQAFEEVDPETDDLARLINRPNPLQAWPEFFENLMGFKFITGNTYAHGIETSDDRFGEMWVMPPQFTRLKADESFETVIVAYILEIYGRSSDDIPPENMLHLKYWNPDYSSTGSHLYGMSPLKAARNAMLASNNGQIALSKALQNMGASGMIYPDDDVELGEQQQSQIQQFFDQQGSGPDNYKRALVASAKLGWTSFGMSPVDLEIIEGKKLSMRDICNIYSFPSELLNDPDNKIQANKKESRKQLWLDVGIPSLERSYSELNRWLTKPYVDVEGTRHEARYPDRHIDYDIAGIEALAADMQTKAQWLNTAWWLTPNEKRAEMDFEAFDDGSFDIPWAGMGLMPIDGSNSPELPENDEEVKKLLLSEYTNGQS